MGENPANHVLNNQVPKTPSKHRLQAVDSASHLNRIERVRETVVFWEGTGPYPPEILPRWWRADPFARSEYRGGQERSSSPAWRALCAVGAVVLGCLYSVRVPGVLVFPTSLWQMKVCG